MLDSALYALLHKDDIAGFNRNVRKGLSICEAAISELGFWQLNAQDVDFTDSYFRSADLRGLDLRTACIEGASLAHAQISGACFPVEMTADEILMSVNFGTRLRYRTK